MRARPARRIHRIEAVAAGHVVNHLPKLEVRGIHRHVERRTVGTVDHLARAALARLAEPAYAQLLGIRGNLDRKSSRSPVLRNPGGAVVLVRAFRGGQAAVAAAAA